MNTTKTSTGEASTGAPNDGKQPVADNRSFHLLRRLALESLMPYRVALFSAVICMGIVAAMTAASAWLLDPVVNKVFVQHDRQLLWLIGGAVIAVFAIKSLASYAQDVLLAYVGQHAVSDIQNQLFKHLIHDDVAVFQAQSSGALVSHFTYDINMMRAAVSSTIVGIGRDALSVIFLVGVIFYQDWLLATISIIVGPITIIPLQRLSKHMRTVSRQAQDEMGLLNIALAQVFQGIRVIKSYRLEDFEQGRVNRVVDSLCQLAIRGARIQAAVQPLIDSFGGVAVAAIIVYGGSRVMNGDTTAGAFFSFIGAVLMVYQPMRSLSKVNVSLQAGLAAAERVFALIDRQPTLREAENAKDLPRMSGGISFRGVRFAYNEDGYALDGVDFEAPAGGITALVGPSGAGKSTVFNLIPRFYDANEGRVLVNGHDTRTVTFASLRDSLAVVSQEIVLFDDSVFNNIRCGRLDATEAEVRKAAEAAAASEFIERLPQGYDTRIGEHGLRLSGGQRQRIAIARAILKNAPILLLDEATSALDSESERAIQAALATLMKGRTSLVIAHRLSTVVHARMIHVFDHGRVIESGTHDELLAKNGLYARLYALQFAGSTASETALQTAIEAPSASL
jgi:subfamily B ATP-binding cassette protein MsbA